MAVVRSHRLLLLVAVAFGLAAGLFAIHSTSIGWHLASGRWMLAHQQVLRADPFTFTAAGTPWIDHEWLFQIAVALAEAAGGFTALVGLRCLLTAILAAVLLLCTRRTGLEALPESPVLLRPAITSRLHGIRSPLILEVSPDTPAVSGFTSDRTDVTFLRPSRRREFNTSHLAPLPALVLVVLAVAGARLRFFLRPELCTLILVPLMLALFIGLLERDGPPWTAAVATRMLLLAAVMTLGVNLHGGALVAGLLLGVAWLATVAGAAGRRSTVLLRGGLALTAVAVAALLNPWGWRLYTVPLMITHLVGLPHVPNPEWLSPGPMDLPSLYLALVAAGVVLGLELRLAGRSLLSSDRLRSWLLLLVSAALALRYVRNVGLFFVLLPLVLAPALARWRLLAADGPLDRPGRPRRIAVAAAGAIVVVLLLGFFLRPFHPLGLAADPGSYPVAACSFAERHQLLQGPLYNDVAFGGYLLGRYYPPLQVFLDDRNEINEPLLREVYACLANGDLQRWRRLLQGWQINTALVRYHEPLQRLAGDGSLLGRDGFSTLWFPASRWALVYWDDVAMVLVRRSQAPAALLALEYQSLRPDDLDSLGQRLARGTVARDQVQTEVQRALAEQPGCRRARLISSFLAAPPDGR